MSKIQHLENGQYTLEDLVPEDVCDLTLEQVMALLVYKIVEHPDELEAAVVSTDRIKVIEFDLHPNDRGPVIGRNGYTIKALHTIAKAILGEFSKNCSYRIDVRSDAEDD